jgi:hypothetical protein
MVSLHLCGIFSNKTTIMKSKKIKITSKDVFEVVTQNLVAIEWKLTLQKNRNKLNPT